MRCVMRDMSEEKNILVVAYVFPPIPYAGTHRTVRLLRGMKDRNIRTHVLTIKTYDDIPNDNDLLRKIPDDITIHRTPLIDPWRRFQNWKKTNHSIYGFRYIVKVVSALLRFIIFPDHMVLWVPFAVYKGLHIIRRNHIDTIYVSSPPHSTQLIGYLLKKITGKRLVIDFRDPIVGNVGSKSLNDPTDFISKIESRLIQAYELCIVNHADSVIVNTETHRSELSRRYNRGSHPNIVTVHNSYDPDDYKNARKITCNQYTIAHVGSVYGTRKADILFQALRILEQEFFPDALKIHVLFVGLNDGALEQSVKSYSVEKYVTIRKFVPHREAVSVMVSADMLLLIKMTGPNSFGQIPGKFFEYLGAGRKILCLGPRESEVAGIIKKMDVGYNVDDDLDELVSILRSEYKAFLEGKNRQTTGRDVANYSAGQMAKRISDLF